VKVRVCPTSMARLVGKLTQVIVGESAAIASTGTGQCGC
jgi:hypothetical protein